MARRSDPDDPLLGAWHYDVDTLGFNYRITDFQCALGLSQLERLSHWVHERNHLAARYRELLGDVDGLTLPAAAREGELHGHHLFVVRFTEGARRRRFMFERLREAGIGTQLHYIPIPCHGLYRGLGFDGTLSDLPQARAYYEQALSLPLFATMTGDDVERVAGALRRLLAQPLG
jgi:dTDP-4-amino-4,6-dideoxygalactose transaminase